MAVVHPESPPFRHLIHRLSDPDEFGIAVSGVHLNADFLAPQKLPTQVEQFQTPGWSFDFHEAHVKARLFGPLPPDWISLGLLRSPAPSSWYGCPATQGVLLCNPPGVPIDGCITPGFTCMALNIPVPVWEKCRALAGIERCDFGGFAAFQLPPPLYARVERKLQSVVHHLRTSAATPQHAAFALSEATEFATSMGTIAWEFSTTSEPQRDSFRNRARLTRRAESWMREHLDQSVRIPDICLALGVSRRELEYAFRTCTDQSPRDYLQVLRLNAIRIALRHSAAPIIDVALDHGVTHLGRFAAQYRAMFGERPSETSRGSKSWLRTRSGAG